MIKRVEIQVSFTPDEFKAFLEKVGREYSPLNQSDTSFPLWTYPETPGKFLFQATSGGGIGEIRAIPIPGKPGLVLGEVWANDGDWLNLKKSWDLLFNRLNQAGVLEVFDTHPLYLSNTTPQEFINWLNNYHSTIHTVPTETGYYTVSHVQDYPSGRIRRIEILFNWHGPKKVYPPVWGIYFEILEVGGRLKVTPHESDPVYHPWLNALLVELLADYPQVQTPAPAAPALEPPTKPKRRGRYRLTGEDVKYRKRVVKRLNQLKTPKITWKEVYGLLREEFEIDTPDGTLKDWLHNPSFQ